jgi:uncharacterized protein DUF1264
MRFPQFREVAPFAALAVCGLFVNGWLMRDTKAQQESSRQMPTPADGYTVHVTAPHNVNGHIMGPYHHFCKVMKSDPVIVCQIYDSADPNGMLKQIEFIIAKKLTRPAVSLDDWNRLWHDHAVEIATGRVQVLDLPPDKAKEVADLVATTDGIIFSFQFDGDVPTGKIVMAQAVGHVPLSAQQYEQSKKDVLAPAAR